MIVLPKENKMNNFDRAEKACYERLKKQNKKIDREIELEKKLDIAVKALEFYADKNNFFGVSLSDDISEKNLTSDCIDDANDMGWYAQQALKEING